MSWVMLPGEAEEEDVVVGELMQEWAALAEARGQLTPLLLAARELGGVSVSALQGRSGP